MKRLALVCLLATGGLAAQAQTFVDLARVRSVEPQYERVQVPRDECSTEWINEVRPVAGAHGYGADGYGAAVIGGVAGAMVGRQVGHGRGRDAATAVGAVVGAIAGDRIANRDRPGMYQEVARPVQSCRTVSEVQTRITGYRVHYDYRGHQYSTFMREDPGATLPVQVSVIPVERQYHRPY